MPKLLKEFIVITLLTATGTAYSLLSGLAPLPWAEPKLLAGEIRIEDALALDAIWVDARSEEAFHTDRIPEAIFYDPSDASGSLAQILSVWLERPQVIIVYCADAGCGTSKQVAENLRQNIPDAEIYSLKGGWSAWQE